MRVCKLAVGVFRVVGNSSFQEMMERKAQIKNKSTGRRKHN